MKRLVCLLLSSATFTGCCCDINCDYWTMTTERVAKFCADKGGVQSVQWDESSAICKDGTLQAFFQGYKPEGEVPVP